MINTLLKEILYFICFTILLNACSEKVTNNYYNLDFQKKRIEIETSIGQMFETIQNAKSVWMDFLSTQIRDLTTSLSGNVALMLE